MAASTAPRTRRSSDETREHVLDAAQELFYWEGIHATGVDRVAAKAQVAPTTLYRLFASKDELVAAYLERADAGYRAWLSEQAAPDAGTAHDRVLAVFDALAGAIGPDDCRGCPFLMALAEFPDPRSAPHQRAVATKVWVRELLRGLAAEHAREAWVQDPDLLADALALILEGVYGSVQALGADGPAANASATAAALLNAA